MLTTEPAWLGWNTSYQLHADVDALSALSCSRAVASSAQPLSSHATQAHRRAPILTHAPSRHAANKNTKSDNSEMKLPARAQGEFG